MHSRIFLASAIALVLVASGAGCSPDQTPPTPTTGTANTTAAPQTAMPADPGRPAETATSGAGISTVTGGDLMIEISASGVVITANGVSQEAILRDLARLEGFEVITAGVAWESVSQTIQTINLHTALVELLKPHPYQIIYSYDHDSRTDALKRVVVGTPVSTQEGVAMASGSPVTMAPGRYQAPTGTEEPLSEENQAYLNLLLDPSPEVRVEAAEDIEPVGIALDYLGEVVKSDPSPDVRIAATYTLQESKDPRAYNALVRALQDRDPRVLEEVIDALWYIDNSNAIPYLQPFLDHENEDIRSAAQGAIDDLE